MRCDLFSEELYTLGVRQELEKLMLGNENVIDYCGISGCQSLAVKSETKIVELKKKIKHNHATFASIHP